MEQAQHKIGAMPAQPAGSEIEAIVARFESPLLRYAARIVNDAASAQDVVQEAFIRLYRTWHGAWPVDGRLSRWLYRATHNAAIDLIRKEDRRRRLHARHAEEPTLDPAARAADAGEIADRRRIVLDHVAALPPAEREVLVLRLQEGLSYRDIARVTGRTEGNVGCLLHQATRGLAAHFKKAGVI